MNNITYFTTRRYLLFIYYYVCIIFFNHDRQKNMSSRYQHCKQTLLEVDKNNLFYKYRYVPMITLVI